MYNNARFKWPSITLNQTRNTAREIKFKDSINKIAEAKAKKKKIC